MGRPAPRILLFAPDGKHMMLEVCDAKKTFLVVYQGKGFSLRRNHMLLNGRIKYCRTSFAFKGHADRMADRLNKVFQTDRFGVVELDVE